MRRPQRVVHEVLQLKELPVPLAERAVPLPHREVQVELRRRELLDEPMKKEAEP